MKILILCRDDKWSEMSKSLINSYDANALISVAYDAHGYKSDTWSVAITIKKESENLHFEGIATSSYTIVMKDDEDEKELLRVLDNLYNEKIRYGSVPCTCGANDVCKCH